MAGETYARRLVVGALAVVLLLAVAAGAGAKARDQSPPQKPLLGDPATKTVAAAATVQTGFTDSVVFSGLTLPTNLRFAPDGRVFVAEKGGLVVEYDNLQDSTPTTVIDLRSQVDDYWDRGLLGMALDPNFATNGFMYLLYSYDGMTGTDAPKWNDACPTPPGPTTDGCPITGKLIRVTVPANSVVTAPPTVMIQGEWCQQFPSHSIGDLNFGPDGQLYVTGGEGANFNASDYGQFGGSAGSPTPANPCGDPPGGVGQALTPPTAEGGSLRSQSVRRASGEPVLLNGSLLRIDPTTAAGSAGNPLSASTNANARRIVGFGLRNPFRFTFRPGTKEVWIADVGQGTWEEVDRLADPTTLSSPVNFGWPCYEGAPAQPGWQAIGVNLCTSLYSAGTATPPYYAYNHSAAVAPNDGCPTANGSSITAISFYTGNAYPAAYQGALFFGDHTRNCLWVMMPGANGLPDPSNVQLFEGAAANPVDLEAGPNGDLFYVDFDGGKIHRLTYGTTGCGAGTWHAQYFNNTTMTAPAALDQCESAPLNHDWGAGSPSGTTSYTNLVSNGSFEANDNGWVANNGATKAVVATGSMYGNNVLRITTPGGGAGQGVYFVPSSAQPGVAPGAAMTMGVDVNAPAGTPIVISIEAHNSTGGFIANAYKTYPASGARQRLTVTFPSLPAGTTSVWPTVYADSPFPAVTFDVDGVQIEAGTVADPYTDTTGSTGTVQSDNFSAVWTGSFTFANSGQYTFTATADDGIRVYVDGALLINQWQDETSATTFTQSTTLTAGSHDVRVEYYEHTGNAVAKVSWAAGSGNSPPVPVIDSPASTLTYAVGDLIPFSGHATDPEDGALPASALTWTLIIHHCTTPTTCHTHLVQTWTGVSSGSFNAPDHAYPSYLELQLVATDSGGASTTTSVSLQPKTVDLTFASVPSGLNLTIDGTTAAAPFTQTVIVNSANSVSAPTSQTSGGVTYSFAKWSDGGAATHTVVAPTSATTYTATYTAPGSPPVNTAAPTVSGPNRVGKTLTTSNGTWTGTSPISYSYVWQRCTSASSCTNVGTGSRYVIQSADRGFSLRSVVTATNSVGSASAPSALTKQVTR